MFSHTAIACRTLMLCHSAICMQDPHVLSLCYWHAGPSCSVTLLFACWTLMFCHSAICMQDHHILSLCSPPYPLIFLQFFLLTLYLLSSSPIFLFFCEVVIPKIVFSSCCIQLPNPLILLSMFAFAHARFVSNEI